MDWTLNATGNPGGDTPRANDPGSAGAAPSHARKPDRAGERMLHDPLTGVATRAAFAEGLQRALRRADRTGWITVVMALDIDRFRRVNEQFGHAAGDEFLVVMARRLEVVLRDYDVVGRGSGDSSVGRLGGDEFLLHCENVPDPVAAIAIADRVLDALAAPASISGGRLAVTASAGVVLLHPGTGADAAQALLDAEAALLRSKEHGGGRSQLFHENFRVDLAAAIVQEQALHDALELGQFRLVYQPKILLSSQRVMGVEALLRWDDPARGEIGPAEFIPLAEASGLIVPIGEWVLRQACRQLAAWQRAHPSQPPLQVAVNVSARQFDGNLLATVESAVTDAGVDPGSVCLEVTESTVMDDVEAAILILRELKEFGIAVSIDDFGTGYSSLAYLRRLPFDEVKIDRSFVSGLGEDPEDTAIVAAVLSLAHALDRDVVAEGVETVDQLERLEGLGCEAVQGFLFSRPVAPEVIDGLLADQAAGRRLIAGKRAADAVAESRETVLVADDAADLRQLVRMSLTAAGFVVEEATSGVEALEMARRLRPACVVLDVTMPDMTGLQVCAALRADPALSSCTIVMLTSRAEAADKAAAFSLGADDYLVKPFAPRDLVARVRTAIRRGRTSS